jgi:hypothetical protein
MWKVGESLVCGDRVRTQRSGRRGVGVALVRSSFSCCFVFVYRALCSVIEPTCKSCVQTTVQYFYLNLLMLIVVGGGSVPNRPWPCGRRAAPAQTPPARTLTRGHTIPLTVSHSPQSHSSQHTGHSTRPRNTRAAHSTPSSMLHTFGICTSAHSLARARWIAAPCLSPPPALGRKPCQPLISTPPPFPCTASLVSSRNLLARPAELAGLGAIELVGDLVRLRTDVEHPRKLRQRLE